MSEITLLDGAIGQEIVKRSGDRPTPLWSTSVMMEKPDLVGEIHAEHFSAGASVATTNSYALWPDRLARAGLEDRLHELLDVAVAQARRARAAHGSGRIAASLGPLGASYRPDLAVPTDKAAETFRANARALAPHVDVLLIETVSSLHDGRGALMGTLGFDKPVWIAFTVDDDDGTRLRSGEAVADIAGLVADLRPDAVLLNCARPEAISEGLPLIAELGLPFGAYANGFTRITEAFLADSPTVEALEQRHDLGPEDYAGFAMDWVRMGASLVGGCCEVGPDHIRELHRQLVAAGHTLV